MMHMWKKIAMIAGVCGLVLAAGCGQNEETASVTGGSLSVESETVAQTVKDASDELRNSAEKGSTDTLYGKYEIKDAEGVYYYFGEDGICYYVQSGTYEFSHEDGDQVLIQFETQDTPSDYTIEKDGDGLVLRTTYTDATAETAIPFTPVSGTDGLEQMEPFEGIYSAYGEDTYRYEFHADGTVNLVLEEKYTLEDNTVTLSALGNEFTYTYQENEDHNLELLGEDVTVAVLIPAE